MKSQWFTRVWRFWPALLAVAIVFSSMTWLMQPQPKVIQIARLPFDQSLFLAGGIAYSPDRRSLAVSFSGHMNDNNNKLIVYDLVSGQQLFKDPAVLSQFVFDDQGALVYLGGDNGGFGNSPTHEKLMRWNPATQQKEMIAENCVAGPDLEFRVYDLVQDTSNIQCLSVLTLNGRWWIVPRTDGTSLWYERLDARTGISAGKLHLPAMMRSPRAQQITSMCLTQEKNVLLVETAGSREEKNEFALHWIDLTTGQSLHSVSLPNKVDQFCVSLNEITVVETRTAAPDEKPMLMAFHGSRKELQLIALDEIEKLQPNPSSLNSSKMPVPEAVQDRTTVDVNSLTAIIGWRYRSMHSETGRPNGPPEIIEWSPEYYYSIRDLKTGKLLHTGCFHLLSGKNHFDIKENTLDAKKVLPGPVLILSQYIIDNKPEGIWEKSLDKVRSWLNLSTSDYLHKLHFIDARSGTVLNTLQTPYTGGLLSLSADERTLTITHYWDGVGARIEYNYPLHKPWLMIWSWALGVGVIITLLVEARRWFRRRITWTILPGPAKQDSR